VGQDPHPRPPPAKAAHDVRLEPEVEDRDEWAALGGVALVTRVGRRDLGHEILVLPAGDVAGELTGFFGVGLTGLGDDGPKAAARTQMSSQGSSVDARDRRDAGLAQHRGELLGIVEDGGRGVGHDKAAQPGSLGLIVVVDTAVVADEWIRHDHELAGVAGIGRDLLIAGLAGVHHQIALA
jgi:hypothetical protein